MMTYDDRYAAYKDKIDTALAECFGARRGFNFDGLLDSMNYSLTAGGKRIRPILTLEFCRVCGGDVDAALPVACAVEMLHTYSLIHDDLPCMDNDDLRRGKPTNHMVYGECTAVLAGDALQAEAFGTILKSELPAERRAQCAEFLSVAAGVDGICGGQFIDMEAEAKTLSAEELTELQSRKTGSLLVAACTMGAAAAGADEKAINLATRYGSCLGAAFQIRDDMLDVLSTAEELGKPIGSDAQEGKVTNMSMYGEEKCRQMIEIITNVAKDCARELGDADFLCELADRMVVRKN